MDPAPLLPPVPGVYVSVVVGALATTCGVLWLALRDSQKQKDELGAARVTDTQQTVQGLLGAQSSLDALTERIGSVERLVQRIDDRTRGAL